MDVPAEAEALEQRLREAGLTIKPALDGAGLDRSTWTRWKSGRFRPRLDSWLAIQSAATRLLEGVRK